MRILQYELHGFEQLTLMDNIDYYPLNNHLFTEVFHP